MAFVYSCCFWFSLRLGGILIGLVSIIETTIALIIFCICYNQPQIVSEQISEWKKNINFLYLDGYLEMFQADIEKYFSYCITFCCIYLFLCVLYVYGAFTCNNTLMIAFILVELIRLITFSIFVTLWLIILKHNTMDIGLVIGASVSSGFVLMGLFYLWVCAATLPVLINEIEREERIATINKLQSLLENKNQRVDRGNYKKFIKDQNEDLEIKKMFIIPRPKYAGEEKADPYNGASFIN